MNKLELKLVEHTVKVGQECGAFKPNITEDTIFYEDGEVVGFFIKEISGKIKNYIEIANKEFRGKNVPKTLLERAGKLRKLQEGQTIRQANKVLVEQMSTIIGSIPPKALMKREYASRSSVHNEPKAKTFIKAMLLTCSEAENIIKKIAPTIYENQLALIQENVPEKYRLGKLFTSSISNYNISAPFHRDNGNIRGCVNVIITKRLNSKGGNLHVPDYGLTFDSSNNSMLVYPAWKNVHGVTPIEPTFEGGYRNSLIFYPLKAFKGIE